jgi:hypothetical protein
MAREYRLCHVDALLQCAREACGSHSAPFSPSACQLRVIDQSFGKRAQLFDVVDESLALRGEKNAERLREIVRVRTGQNGPAEPCWFERVLSSVFDQASAQKCEWSGPIEEAELA